ncbi:heme-binding domain-containing protein [Chryseolinea sp. H1M3-3]|uniref:heme-binding domain-containing protein n=1 Tax=Chryseolinea sp. H1M3-3 TaxID=3034144 RepID=UPI0023EB9A26|nr:heme-binding domain-containing protein [Chryseolinea sp. H1M3-3]
MRSWKSKVLLIIIAIIVIIQFIRPEKNVSSEPSPTDISTKYSITDPVKGVLEKACTDCHSNNTRYPWYSQVQPIAWWMNDHVEEGKGELNFSTFTSRPLAIQFHKFEEVVETVKEGEMPLPSYTWVGMHPEAKLSQEEKDLLIHWAEEQMNAMKQQYPADSLVRKKR